MSERLLDEIDIDCPYCNKEFSISINSVGDTVTCPFCQKDFETEDNGIISALEDAENEIGDLLSNLI